jgi:hypothetical protein
MAAVDLIFLQSIDFHATSEATDTKTFMGEWHGTLLLPPSPVDASIRQRGGFFIRLKTARLHFGRLRFFRDFRAGTNSTSRTERKQ